MIQEIENLGDSTQVEEVIIPIRGMSCASCVNRIETRLRNLPGVMEAAVNLSTEKAIVRFFPSVHSINELKTTIQDLGYEPLEVIDELATTDYEKKAREQEIRKLGLKTLIGVLLSIPLMLGSFPEWFPWLPELFTRCGKGDRSGSDHQAGGGCPGLQTSHSENGE